MSSESKKDEQLLRMVRQSLGEIQGQEYQEPEEPLPQECCGQSCKPCVFDIHRKDLINWAKDVSKKLNRGSISIYEHIYGKEKENIDQDPNFLSKYQQLELIEIEEMSKDTRLFTFSSSGPLIDMPLGGHLRARITINGHHISRQYTPTLLERATFQVPIKIYPTGKFTKNIQNWNVGSLVEWIGPFVPSHGDWLKNSTSLQCFAGGTGIAPFVRIIESLLDDDNCEIRIQLVFCVRSEEDILFKETLDRWTKHWNFSLVIVASSQKLSSTSTPHLAKNCVGSRLKEELCLSLLKDFSLASNAGLRVAVCGSKSFEKDVINFAKRGGLPESQLFRFPG